MSWLQQLVGKLKSLFGRKSAPTEEAGTPPKAETAPAEDKAAEQAALTTEEKPAAEEPAAATEEPAAEEPSAPAAETAEVSEAAEPVAEAPAATEAEPAATDAEPAADVEPSTDEPVAEIAPAEAGKPAADTPATTAATVAPADEPVAEATPAEAGKPAVDTPATTEAPATEPEEPKRAEATDPALSTLDVDGITAELIPEGPYGQGSGKPTADGSAPSADFTVKGKESSKLFHTAKSPYFTRTKADVWFKSEADAESAGFQAWDHKKRAAAKK